jgi:hypothetical protein
MSSASSGCQTGLKNADLAHNPEVAGSNPAPATKIRGPFPSTEGAFCMRSVNGATRTGRDLVCSPCPPAMRARLDVMAKYEASR